MNRITTNITLHKCLFCCFRCATLIITLSHITVLLVLLFAGLGLSMLIRLLLPTESFRRTLLLLNHFISKVVHDLFWLDCSLLGAIAMHYAHLGFRVRARALLSFRREVLANGPRLRQGRFGYFFA